jgi:hypothetical protein
MGAEGFLKGLSEAVEEPPELVFLHFRSFVAAIEFRHIENLMVFSRFSFQQLAGSSIEICDIRQHLGRQRQ